MPAVGQAYYELTARDQALLSSMTKAEARIRSGGTEVEKSFGGAFDRAAPQMTAGATRTTTKVGGVFAGMFNSIGTGFNKLGSSFGGSRIGGVFDQIGLGADRLSAKSEGLGAGLGRLTTRVGGLGGAVKGAGGVMQAFGIPPVLGWTAAVGAGVAVMGKAVGAASDLQETQSKVGVVFGQSAGEILAWGKTSSTAFGQSQNSALGAAATFGNLFVALKLPNAEIPKMSIGLTELASDLASFNNVPVEDALLALRSGLAGETEPLRRFGVNLNEATIAQKALELGLIRTTKEAITPAIKAQATYALILDQTKTAQGDFARTSDGLANRQRIAAARIEDAFAKMGEKILPLVSEILPALTDAFVLALGAVGDFIDVIGKIAGPVVAAASGVEGFLNSVDDALRDLSYNLNIWHLMGPDIERKAIESWDSMTRTSSEGAARVTAAVEKTMKEDAPQIATALTGGVADGLTDGAGTVKTAAEEGLRDPMTATMREARERARLISGTIPGEISDALRDDRTEWQQAWDQLKEDAENSMSTTVEMARIKAKLAKIEASKGWASGDPVWIQSLKDTRTILQNRLDQLEVDARERGSRGALGLAGGLKDKRQFVRDAADTLISAAIEAMKDFRSSAGTWGTNTGAAYTSGLLAGLDKKAVSTKMAAIAKLLEAGSPPKYRESPLYGIERWAFATGETFPIYMARGMDSKAGLLRTSFTNFFGKLSDTSRITANPASFRGDAASAVGGSISIGDIHLHVDVDKLVASDALQVRQLGRDLGNEIRLSLTRTPSLFALPGR